MHLRCLFACIRRKPLSFPSIPLEQLNTPSASSVQLSTALSLLEPSHEEFSMTRGSRNLTARRGPICHRPTQNPTPHDYSPSGRPWRKKNPVEQIPCVAVACSTPSNPAAAATTARKFHSTASGFPHRATIRHSLRSNRQAPISSPGGGREP
jgi:hypothetical protein